MTVESVDKVYVLKLTAGDMIVGLLKEVTNDEYIIDNPHFMVHDQQGQLALAPYLPVFKTKTLPFNKSSTDVHGEAGQDIENLYDNTTRAASKIITPPKKKLILDV